MCFFRKKTKKIEINSKYKLQDFVQFRYRDSIALGYIVDIKEKDGAILYDIQIGGECPAVIPDVEEKTISLKR